jgi:hypothetical protein
MTANPVRMSAKFARHAMYAHRLWITLWMSLGHPGENRAHPGGNRAVTPWQTLAAHSRASRSTQAGHSRCARSRRSLAGGIRVIPTIHRPYDDYQVCISRQIPTQVGERQAEARMATGPGSAGSRSVRSRVARPEFNELPTR